MSWKRVPKRLWAGWKRFAHFVGVVNRYVFLTVFYFVIVSIVNVALRLFRVDLLDRSLAPAPTHYRRKDTRTGTYRQQF
jgi:hypothetical protein